MENSIGLKRVIKIMCTIAIIIFCIDDELPDYIMVMVANKKTQQQMTDDLSLFLATNTEKFTAW